MIELYLYIKTYLDYFPGKLKYSQLGKWTRFTFWVPVLKVLRLYHDTYILSFWIDLSTKPNQGLWFNRTYLLLFQNMSIKIYSNFFLSSGCYNFKINYLKDKMRQGMWVHIFQNNLVWSPLQHEYYFWYRRSKC